MSQCHWNGKLTCLDLLNYSKGFLICSAFLVNLGNGELAPVIIYLSRIYFHREWSKGRGRRRMKKKSECLEDSLCELCSEGGEGGRSRRNSDVCI